MLIVIEKLKIFFNFKICPESQFRRSPGEREQDKRGHETLQSPVKILAVLCIVQKGAAGN